jgi:hypothetical protein
VTSKDELSGMEVVENREKENVYGVEARMTELLLVLIAVNSSCAG